MSHTSLKTPCVVLTVASATTFPSLPALGDSGSPAAAPGSALSPAPAPQHEHGGGWLETSSPLPSLARAVEALGLLPPSRVIYCLVCRVSATQLLLKPHKNAFSPGEGMDVSLGQQPTGVCGFMGGEDIVSSFQFLPLTHFPSHLCPVAFLQLINKGRDNINASLRGTWRVCSVRLLVSAAMSWQRHREKC